MAQSAAEFIDRLEFLGLLEEKVLENLRRQITDSKNPVSPHTLAKLLVDQGQLTPFQAKKLVGDEPASTPEAPLPAPREPAGPSAAARAPSPKGAPPAVAKAPAPAEPANRPQDDDFLGLAPGEDQDLTPSSSAAKMKPAAEEEVVDLLEVPETPPPKKSPSPKPAKPKPTAPALPPSPLDLPGGLSGLEPLSGLSPLDAAGGLTPLPDSRQMPANLTSGQATDPFNDPLLGASSQLPGGSFGQPPGSAPAGATRQAPAKKLRNTTWDTPLLLLGGGGLIVLLGLAGFIYVILMRGSADELFQQAENDYNNQSYKAAAENYEKFLKSFPSDGKASLARVRRGMCRLRPLVQSSDWARSLTEANAVLPEIEKEIAFAEARNELATLLPDIAAGFATRARAEPDTAKSQGFVDLADEALKLVNNSSYIPTSIRTTSAVEPRIQQIQENVSLARRDINRDTELSKSLAEIDAFIKDKKTSEAYAVRKQLVKAYPDLETNADLNRAVRKISAGEQDQIKTADSTLAALTEDDAPVSEARVVLASHGGPGVTGVEGRVILVLARGAVYALDAASGRVLWRRFVGFETKAQPQLLSKQADADALLVDGRRNEVVRVNATTGKLVWRLPIGAPFTGPVIGHERAFVATRAGRVIQIDPQTGQVAREAAFTQQLAVEPGLDSRGRVLFQLGEHSNVYLLKLDTLRCESVYYTGHKAGSVVVPPLLTQNLLFVAENAGSDYSLLHVIATDTGDAGLKEAQDPLRLKGRVLVPLAVSGRRVVVVTDQGEISLLEIDAANEKQPVRVVVRFGPTSKEPVLGFPLAEEGLMWIADRRLVKYEIQLGQGKLVRKSMKLENESFQAPLELFGDAVLHIRRRKNSTGVTVAASQIESDQVLWETNLATPLAGPVQVDAAKNQLVAISSYAEFYYVDQAVLKSGLGKPPVTVIGANAPGLTFTKLVELAPGKLALASTVDNEKAVVYESTSEFPPRLAKLEFPPGTAVGEAAVFRGGMLQASNQGRVYLLDLKTGGNLVLPFQPRLTPGDSLGFLRPAVLGPDKNEFVVADNRKKLYRVGVKDQPQPFLAELAQLETTAEMVSPLAVAGDTLYGVLRPGATDTLAAYHLPDLKPGQETPLTGRVTYGPEQVGEVVFLAADQDGLLCLEAGEKERWRTPLAYGPLAGRPLADGADYILASQSGTIWRVAGDSGRELARLDMGEPLGAGPVAHGGRLLLAGSDGVLHVVRSPVATAAAP